MKRAILLMFLFVSAIVRGQVVKGVFVGEQDSPLAGINITLQTLDNQKQIGGTSTNAEGAFSIGYKQSGSYLLRASCIGYRSYAMELKDISGVVDLGRLQLAEDPVALGEVVVEAASTIQKVDGQV
ncbi:MAG: carboxypeptidase-like regulatory domain-containing protein, partial [Tannerellaceae bacterium]